MLRLFKRKATEDYVDSRFRADAPWHRIDREGIALLRIKLARLEEYLGVNFVDNHTQRYEKKGGPENG